MTDVHVIVLVCVLGVVGEALRIRRPGQVYLGPGFLGRYSLTGELLDITGGASAPHVLPLFPLGPSFRLTSGFAPGPVSAAHHLDVERARRIIDGVRHAAARVIPYSRLMFFYLVILVPLALLTSYLHNRWLVLGAVLLVIQAVLLVEFALGSRQLMPAEKGQLIQDLVMKLVFPPDAVFAVERFADAAAREELHPLAAAVVLCPESEARRLAGVFLRMWQHPVEGMDAERAAEYLEVARGLCVDQGWNLDELTACPARDHADSLSYCPRCLAQYLVRGGECSDCPGVTRLDY